MTSSEPGARGASAGAAGVDVFPSGHAASAAAFSGVVGSQLPALRVPMNALAVAVVFSRVYTGVHYPGDVLAGWLLGRGIAAGLGRAADLVAAHDPGLRS